MFCEVRNFLCFIKENYGGCFRKTAFAGMLEPLVRLRSQAAMQKKRLQELNIEIKKQEEDLKNFKNTMFSCNSVASCVELNTPASEKVQFQSNLEKTADKKKPSRNESLSKKVNLKNKKNILRPN